MDEAREEAKAKEDAPGGLDLVDRNVDQISADGVVTQEEIKALKQEIARLKSLLKE